jgi:hypothetical protein
MGVPEPARKGRLRSFPDERGTDRDHTEPGERSTSVRPMAKDASSFPIRAEVG